MSKEKFNKTKPKAPVINITSKMSISEFLDFVRCGSRNALRKVEIDRTKLSTKRNFKIVLKKSDNKPIEDLEIGNDPFENLPFGDSAFYWDGLDRCKF